jgi:hypothetical protein
MLQRSFPDCQKVTLIALKSPRRKAALKHKESTFPSVKSGYVWSVSRIQFYEKNKRQTKHRPQDCKTGGKKQAQGILY